MKAFNESRRKQFIGTGLILLLAEKLAALTGDRDEHNQTDILTSGLTSLPPSRPALAGQWLLGVCSPLQWRNRRRFSRRSLTHGCVGDGRESIGFKERDVVTPLTKLCQENFRNFFPVRSNTLINTLL